MSIQPDVSLESIWLPIQVIQNSDATFVLQVRQPGTVLPYNLTGCQVNVVVKPSRYDSDASGVTYSATIDVDPTTGKAYLTMPASDLTVSGVFWYHADVTASGSSITVNIGPFEVQAA